ncbi:proline dehydrogenase family protein [Motilimonas sp. KMU-193]|uniref:proline dehydrogenase family protein n=1 Tax=Motilimonas sp. KMU-193 TaxID=3388668 RepID=UPI00396AF789
MLKVDDYFSPSILECSAQTLWRDLADHYLCQEHPLILQMQNYASISSWEMSKTTQLAANIIAKVRADNSQKSLAQAFLEEYSLSTQEGILLLCLAESLLRISDPASLDGLLRERLSQINWSKHLKNSDSFLVNASTWALLLTGRLTTQADQKMTMKQGVKHLISHLTEPMVRKALNKAIKMIAEQYIMGSTIEQALEVSLSQAHPKHISTQVDFSFDYLTESALINQQVQQAKNQYIQAIHHIAHHNRNHGQHHSISIRLSVLQPQFDYRYRQRTTAELVATLQPLLELAKALDVAVYIDAETATKMELCLTVFERLFTHPALRGWDKLGIAVQANSKRSLACLGWLAVLAKKNQTSILIRLVKGAYGSEDIRQCQLNGLSAAPVFTSQAATDISFLCCARWLLSSYVTPYLKAEFATHNPYTVAALEVMANQHPIKLQRVYGMGEPLYSLYPHPNICVLAAFGPQQKLVPFILRRLLEFASQPGFQPHLQTQQQPLSELIEHPIDKYAKLKTSERLTFSPLDTPFSLNLACQQVLSQWLRKIDPYLNQIYHSSSLINGKSPFIDKHDEPGARELPQPQWRPNALDETYTQLLFASQADCHLAIDAAKQGYKDWQHSSFEQRKQLLTELTPILISNAPQLLPLYILSTGQHLFAAENELKQAIKLFEQVIKQADDVFNQQEISLADTTPYHWQRQGRGIWLCCATPIHPLITLLQQLAAALICGNTVIVAASPITAQISAQIVSLFLHHGIPPACLHLIISDPAWSLPMPTRCIAELSGISGSMNETQCRKIHKIKQSLKSSIQLQLSGTTMNTMIIDSSAAFDRLIPIILTLAFDLAGQSPTSLKLICVEQEIAEKLIYLLSNAMIELDIANNELDQSCIGPLLESTKVAEFVQYAEQLSKHANLIRQTPMAHDLNGYHVAPSLFEVKDIKHIKPEIDGPVLHIYCYSSNAIPKLIDDINSVNSKGYCAIHSQHQARLRQLEHGILGRHLLINQSHSLSIAAYHAMLYDELACLAYSQMESTLCQNAGKH